MRQKYNAVLDSELILFLPWSSWLYPRVGTLSSPSVSLPLHWTMLVYALGLHFMFLPQAVLLPLSLYGSIVSCTLGSCKPLCNHALNNGLSCFILNFRGQMSHFLLWPLQNRHSCWLSLWSTFGDLCAIKSNIFGFHFYFLLWNISNVHNSKEKNVMESSVAITCSNWKHLPWLLLPKWWIWWLLLGRSLRNNAY